MSEEIKEITYKKLSQIERFVGPDIEDAPDDCSPGSTFFEAQEGSDVGRLYVFDGTRWAEKQQRVTGITLEGENINIVDPETLGKEATLQILKAELAAIKSAQTDGSQKVQVSGTKVVESAPVTGIKTVTSTVAEVFAGSSRKANRSKLVIRNLHQAVAIRIGGSGITDTIGQSLEPGASVEIDFSPSTTVPIYAVSTAGNVSVEVLEV